ncbi:unnamed protein product, partial [Prorocentrum cordatum]
SAMGAQLTENGPSVSSILRNSTCLFSGVPRNFYTPSSPLSALHAAPIHTDACKLYSTREATENSGGEDDEKDEADTQRRMGWRRRDSRSPSCQRSRPGAKLPLAVLPLATAFGPSGRSVPRRPLVA